MSQVEFNEEGKSASMLYAKFQASNEVPTLVRWLMSSGVAKSAGQANVYLIGIMLISLVTTGIVVYNMNSVPTKKFSDAQIKVLEENMRNIQSQQI